MFRRLNVVGTDELPDILDEIIVVEAANETNHVPLVTVKIQNVSGLVHDHIVIILATPNDRHSGKPQKLSPLNRLIPAKTNILIIPNREHLEETVKSIILDRVNCLKVLTTDTPTLRDFMLNSAVEIADPGTRRVVTRLKGASVDVVTIHRRVFPIHFLKDDDFTSLKFRETRLTNIIVSSSW